MCESATQRLIDIEEQENLERDRLNIKEINNEIKSKFYIDLDELVEQCVDKYLDANCIKSGELSVSNLLHIDGIYDAFRFMKKQIDKEVE